MCWGGGWEINTLEGIKGNKSTEVLKICHWVSMVITREHTQHSYIHTAAMTEVLNVQNVTLE